MLCDLALHGVPGAADGTMTERKFRRWIAYRNQHLLPLERIELYLAQLTQWVARSAGIDADIDQYLIEIGTGTKRIDDEEDEIEEEFDVDEARKFFEFPDEVNDGGR